MATKANSKRCQISETELFSASHYWPQKRIQNLETSKMELFAKIVKK